jgi:tRNA(fMet)-specific endonuclease VapC
MKMSGLAAAAVILAAFSASIALAGTTPKPLLHGNYCGPGNNAPLAPIDALDEACAHHDACTPDGGLPSKTCNLRLQSEAESVAQDPSQPDDLRAMAGIVASGAAMMPSQPGRRPLAAASVSGPGQVPGLAQPGLETDTGDEPDDADTE